MGNQYYKPKPDKIDVDVLVEEQRNLSRRSTGNSDAALNRGPGPEDRRTPRDRITGSEIRLLKLRAGKPEDDLEGNIEIFSFLRSLGQSGKQPTADANDHDSDGGHDFNGQGQERRTQNPPEYEALSYNWGDSRIVSKIKIIEGGEVYEIGIRQNLMAALKIMRHPPKFESEHNNAFRLLRNSARTELETNPTSMRLFEELRALIHQGGEAALDYLRGLLWDCPEKYLNELIEDIKSRPRTAASSESKHPDHEWDVKNYYEMIEKDWTAETPAHRYLWIDAICIDQEDNEEKSRQIPRMLDIYMQAKEVCVWLGEEVVEAESAKAMDFVDHVLKDWESGNIAANELEWDAFIKLLRRPWFSRRWIVQEITRAQNASVYCGEKKVAWKNFADVVSLFNQHQVDIQDMFKRSVRLGNDPERIGDLNELSAIRLVHASDHLFRRDVTEGVSEKLLPLEGLISTLTAFEAAEPKDIIYAVIWLAKDATPVSKRAFRSYRPHRRPTAKKAAEDTKRIIAAMEKKPSAREDGGPGNIANLESGTEKAAGDEEGVTETAEKRSEVDKKITKKIASLEDKIGKAEGEGKGVTETIENGPEVVEKENTGRITSLAEDADKTSGGVAEVKLPRSKEFYIERFMTMLNYKRFIVDYDKTLFEVCYDFMRFCSDNSKRIDLICRPWAPEPNAKEVESYGQLPSWIRRLSAHGIFSHSKGGPIERINADPLVGRPRTGEKQLYNADRGVQVAFKTHWQSEVNSTDKQAWMNIEIPQGTLEDVRLQKRHLVVTGFVLDQICHVHPAARGGNIPVEWLSAVQWADSATEPPDDFWRTLVGNRDLAGDRAPYLWKRACQHVFKNRVVGGDLNVRRRLMTSDSDTIRDFLNRVEHVIFRRSLLDLRYQRMLSKQMASEKSLEGVTASTPPGAERSRPRTSTFTKGEDFTRPPLQARPTIVQKAQRVAIRDSNGETVRSRLALGPCDAQSGDIIVIVFGCCVPVVLRRVKPDVASVTPWSWQAADFEYNLPGNKVLSEKEKESKAAMQKEERFQLIGECYVHGEMDGEAFKVPNVFREFREFTIV